MSPETFRTLRDKLGLTQPEWADWLGVSRPTIARAELGKAGDPITNTTMTRLAEAYASGWRPAGWPETANSDSAAAPRGSRLSTT